MMLSRKVSSYAAAGLLGTAAIFGTISAGGANSAAESFRQLAAGAAGVVHSRAD